MPYIPFRSGPSGLLLFLYRLAPSNVFLCRLHRNGDRTKKPQHIPAVMYGWIFLCGETAQEYSFMILRTRTICIDSLVSVNVSGMQFCMPLFLISFLTLCFLLRLLIIRPRILGHSIPVDLIPTHRICLSPALTALILLPFGQDRAQVLLTLHYPW